MYYSRDFQFQIFLGISNDLDSLDAGEYLSCTRALYLVLDPHGRVQPQVHQELLLRSLPGWRDTPANLSQHVSTFALGRRPSLSVTQCFALRPRLLNSEHMLGVAVFAGSFANKGRQGIWQGYRRVRLLAVRFLLCQSVGPLSGCTSW